MRRVRLEKLWVTKKAQAESRQPPERAGALGLRPRRVVAGPFGFGGLCQDVRGSIEHVVQSSSVSIAREFTASLRFPLIPAQAGIQL